MWWVKEWAKQMSKQVSALSIYCGHFSLNNLGKTPHSSPVRVRYGVFFMSAKLDWSFTTNCLAVCRCVVYDRNIYKVYSIAEMGGYIWYRLKLQSNVLQTNWGHHKIAVNLQTIALNSLSCVKISVIISLKSFPVFLSIHNSPSITMVRSTVRV